MSDLSFGAFPMRDPDHLYSPRIIVPMVLDLVPARNVVDLGCNEGWWLSVFQELDVNDILGVDGPWIDRAQLRIPQDRFLQRNLEEPFRADRRFDLVVSLEVAEHLAPSSAETFVETLVSLGDVILFSAGIPFQGGPEHLSEQWPTFWASLFAESDYLPIDVIRDRIWNDDRVYWWYRQNILIFARRSAIEANNKLKQARLRTDGDDLVRIHPANYFEIGRRLESSPSGLPLRKVLSTLPRLMVDAFLRRKR